MQIATPQNEKSLRIHERAVASSKRYLIAEADLLESIIEVDRDRTYEVFGETYLTPYCEKYLGITNDVAAVFVRVARKSQSVPELNQAVQDGKLTVTKAKVIASVVTPTNQEQWINKAATISKAKLEKEVAIASPHAKKPEKAKPTGEDRYRLEFEINDEQMAQLKRAQDIASQKLKRAATLQETQAELLKTYLAKHDPIEKAQRSRDRSSKMAIKKAVAARDKGQCQAQKPDGTKCGETRWTHQHHIVERSAGGPDTLENLTTLCSGHHRMWHRGMGSK